MLRLLGVVLGLGTAAPALGAEPFFVGRWAYAGSGCDQVETFTATGSVYEGDHGLICRFNDVDVSGSEATIQSDCAGQSHGQYEDSYHLVSIDENTMRLTFASSPNDHWYLYRCS